MVVKGQHHTTKGIWIWGKSGSGKSQWVRDNYPDAYFKSCNKWWDSYKQQEVVHMEDFDPSHKVLQHHIKLWADKYHTGGETKGSQAFLNHTTFIITS